MHSTKGGLRALGRSRSLPVGFSSSDMHLVLRSSTTFRGVFYSPPPFLWCQEKMKSLLFEGGGLWIRFDQASVVI